MTSIAAGLFNRAIFGDDQSRRRTSAAQGLSQTFATILSRQMRQSSDGDEGPLGINGGASGDIYGGFMDDALGKVLAHSPAMKSINQALERELAGPNQQTAEARATALNRVAAASVTPAALMGAAEQTDTSLGTIGAAGLSQFGASSAGAADNRGPLLLPPAPDPLAPALPAPTSLKG